MSAGRRRPIRELLTVRHELGARVAQAIHVENTGHRWFRENEISVRAIHAADYERYCTIGKEPQ